MNKVKLLALLIGLLVFGESVGIIYFASRAQDVSRKFDGMKPNYEKLTQEEKALSDKYSALLKESETIKADRNNLLAQAKVLISDNNRVRELEERLAKFETDNQDIQKNRDDLKGQNQKLQEVVKQLMNSQSQLTQERDSLKTANDKLRKDDVVKELNKQVSALQKEKDRVSSDLEAARKKLDVADLRKNQLEKEKLDVAAELKKYKQDLADAFNKNKRLQAEVERMPKKFTEIARQNERLVKETGEMHYNLGVFYTKGREYKRAIAEFEKAIEINPNDSYSHFNLGYIYAEYMVNRKKAVENFRHYLRLAKGDDKDVDWAKQYILTWETYEGKRPME